MPEIYDVSYRITLSGTVRLIAENNLEINDALKILSENPKLSPIDTEIIIVDSELADLTIEDPQSATGLSFKS